MRVVWLKFVYSLLLFGLSCIQSSVKAQPRIRKGDEVNGGDPGGNIPVFLFFRNPGEGDQFGSLCTGLLANNEWIVTAAHCLEGTEAGRDILVLYTNSTGSRRLVANTTIAEIYRDPDYGISLPNSILSLLALTFYGITIVSNDFGMARLVEPIVDSCEDGLSCTTDSPDIPTNPMFAYSVKPESYFARLFDRLFGWLLGGESPGMFNRDEFYVFGYGGVDGDVTGIGRLRRAILSNSGGRVGQYWRSSSLGLNPSTCDGDSGGPWLLQAYNDSNWFAVVGVLSGGRGCGDFFGLFAGDLAYRFTEETADAIQSNVESTGGSCTTMDMNGDKVLYCLNPP